MSSRSLPLFAALMILMTLLTTTHCIINTTTITSSSSRCDGGSTADPSCLIGEIDLDSEEFMMDSEIRRRILQAGNSNHFIDKSKIRGLAATRCDRNSPSCPPIQNLKAPGPKCGYPDYNRECNKYTR